MSKLMFLCLVTAMLLCPIIGYCATDDSESLVGSGSIDEQGLDFDHFEMTPDGFVKGEIVNHSKALRKALKVDMWTTNLTDTRIYWRRTVTVGDLEPGAKYDVKERHEPDVDPAYVKFMFRIHGTR